jgi:tRNA threonylcarbamoyladenosine modification (KEOPS) complex  Pcc1 subunit
MSERARASIRLKLNDQKQIDTLISALSPETKAPPNHRSKTKIEKDGSFLILTITAEDTVALRATLNAYLWWINSTLKIINVVS